MVRRRLSPRKRLFSASPRKKVVSPRKKLKMSPRKQMKSPRKTPRKTPKKTPSKPSSSTKKSVRRRLLSNYDEPVASCYPGISSVSSVTSTSSRSSNLKRALFQSPDHDQPRPSSSQSIQNSPRRVAKLSRTLFTAPENEKKRKRSDCEEDFTPQREKFARSFSTTDVVPCNVQKQTGLQRRNTEITLGSNPSGDFSEHHKKVRLIFVPRFEIYNVFVPENVMGNFNSFTYPKNWNVASQIQNIRCIPFSTLSEVIKRFITRSYTNPWKCE